jgi:hypothetical protein
MLHHSVIYVWKEIWIQNYWLDSFIAFASRLGIVNFIMWSHNTGGLIRQGPL